MIDMDECCAMFIRESTQKSYDDVTKIFLHEANNLGAQMMAANHNFIVLLMKLKANMVTQMIDDHAQRYKTRCEEYVFKCTLPVKDLVFSSENNT